MFVAVVLAMVIPRMSQAQKDSTVLLSAIHHPEPHGSSESFTTESVPSTSKVRMETKCSTASHVCCYLN
ncbi:hypothetical protein CLU79DRAFT_774062 [Phycomyces nitens]|nr:hypothetical protein CLU79DRAFT_774062 [Phycomyces nitens]